MGCLIKICGAGVGFILCIIVGKLLYAVTGSDEIAVLGSIVTFAVCIVLSLIHISEPTRPY